MPNIQNTEPVSRDAVVSGHIKHFKAEKNRHTDRQTDSQAVISTTDWYFYTSASSQHGGGNRGNSMGRGTSTRQSSRLPHYLPPTATSTTISISIHFFIKNWANITVEHMTGHTRHASALTSGQHTSKTVMIIDKQIKSKYWPDYTE